MNILIYLKYSIQGNRSLSEYYARISCVELHSNWRLFLRDYENIYLGSCRSRNLKWLAHKHIVVILEKLACELYLINGDQNIILELHIRAWQSKLPNKVRCIRLFGWWYLTLFAKYHTPCLRTSTTGMSILMERERVFVNYIRRSEIDLDKIL